MLSRMVFVVNASGEKVATATAFYDISDKDQSGSGVRLSVIFFNTGFDFVVRNELN